jgi:hypothetical protein
MGRYEILEVTSGNLTTESFVVDKTGEVMQTIDVVKRLASLEQEIETLKSKLRVSGWCPID